LRRVLTIMETGHNALLTEAMRSIEARTDGGLPDSVVVEERSLRRHIADMKRYILLEEKKCDRMDADKVGLWRKAVSAGEADLDRLVARIAADHPAYHELKYATSFVHPGAVLQRLGHDRSLLCLFMGKEALYLLLLDDRGARLVKDEDVAGITNAANELRGALRDHGSMLNDPAGAYTLFVNGASALHEHVFTKLQPGPYAHLAIMPDGVFHYVPFDVFLVEKPVALGRDYARLHYLIQDHTVQLVPMLRPWTRGTRNKAEAPSAYLGMAPLYTGSDLAPLRSNAREVEAARAVMGGQVLSGNVADEAAFKRLAGSATVLHLAMHTASDPADPAHMALAFGGPDMSEDGLLNMHELYGMDLSARLALLSACNTGTGPLLGGEGIMSMARAFQYTGCPSVMMDLWTCDDEVSTTVVSGFFANLREGLDLDDALRSAKLAHLNSSDPLKAHPYYWATLVLLGDERPIDLPRPWYTSAWAWALAGLGIAVLLIRKRFR
jgi:CHAT domain